MSRSLAQTALLVLAATAGDALAAAAPDITILHAERLLLDIDGRTVTSLAEFDERKPPSAIAVRFAAFGRPFDLELEMNARLTAAGPARRALALYRGRLAGSKQPSWVRLSILEGRMTALIWDGRELYGIEPADAVYARPAGAPKPSAEPVIYRFSDVLIDPRALSCGVGDAPARSNGLDGYRSLVEELNGAVQASGSAFQIDIGLVADFEFVQFFGNNSEAQLLARMNLIDGIFSEQVSTRLNVGRIQLFETPADPFSSSVPGELLEQLGTYKNSAQALRDQGILHLFTRRDLDDEVIGIAYLDSLCSPRFGASLSENRRATTTDALIAAHEIGHNFGAVHDGAPGEACASTPESFLMAPHYNGSSEFSQCSIDTMLPRVAAASCANALLDADVSIVPEEDPYFAVAQSRFDYSITVRNLGVENATGVSAAVVLPDSLQIFAANADGGDCVISSGQVDCDMGDIPGNSARWMTLDLNALQDGDYTADLSVAADNDQNPGNNHHSATITVADRADIRVTLAQPDIVVRGDSVTILAVVGNLGESDATDVEASFTIPPGAQVLGVSSADGDCEIGFDDIVCRLDSLRKNAGENIAYTWVTDETGSFRIEATAAATEPDPDEANNSAHIDVEVAETLVDLAVSMNSDKTVYRPGETAQVVAFVQNSIISRSDATEVKLDVQLPLGFVLSSAEIVRSTGQCARAGTVLHCDIDRVKISEDVAVSMFFRISGGQRSGQYAFETSATSLGAELDSADNSTVYSVRVSTPSTAPSGGGGGGGAPGPAALIVLSWVLWSRPRCRAHSTSRGPEA